MSLDVTASSGAMSRTAIIQKQNLDTAPAASPRKGLRAAVPAESSAMGRIGRLRATNAALVSLARAQRQLIASMKKLEGAP